MGIWGHRKGFSHKTKPTLGERLPFLCYPEHLSLAVPPSETFCQGPIPSQLHPCPMSGSSNVKLTFMFQFYTSVVILEKQVDSPVVFEFRILINFKAYQEFQYQG